MASVQARINKAITDRLLSDTVRDPQMVGDSLQILMQKAGALLGKDMEIPLYWDMAPSTAKRPYITYGPQQRESQGVSGLCGNPTEYEVPYEVRLSTTGIDPLGQIAIVDRIGALLSGYLVTIGGLKVELYETGEFCYPDFTAVEKGATISGYAYKCRVHV